MPSAMLESQVSLPLHEAMVQAAVAAERERCAKIIEAGDELYSAVAQGSRKAWPTHLRKAMDEYAAASNTYRSKQ